MCTLYTYLNYTILAWFLAGLLAGRGGGVRYLPLLPEECSLRLSMLGDWLWCGDFSAPIILATYPGSFSHVINCWANTSASHRKSLRSISPERSLMCWRKRDHTSLSSNHIYIPGITESLNTLKNIYSKKSWSSIRLVTFNKTANSQILYMTIS